ncbi:MAG: nucleoside hydrolase [Chloroflexi bacterium]|nr:nucleoside hydrolase [Chloroflexota bacterium]
MNWRGLTITLLVLVLTMVPAYAQSAETTVPLIIDTDMAQDDWMAIAFLLQSPAVDVRAVTIAGTGEAHCDPGVRNAMNLLETLGHGDIPVACGREAPLQGEHTFPAVWRSHVDTMAGLSLAANPRDAVQISAVELIAETVEERAAPVTLLTLGPLTNVADFLRSRPDLIGQISHVVVMGGAVHVMGNLTPYVQHNYRGEWNIYVDPLAAAEVVESGVPVTLVPLDATNDARVTVDFVRRLELDRRTVAADFVYDVLVASLPFISSGGYYFWDPMAAAVISDPQVVQIVEEGVTVVTKEGTESGRTAPDPDGNVVRVAVASDAGRFEQVFLNTLNGRDPLAVLADTDTSARIGDSTSTMTPIASIDDLVGTWKWTGPFHFRFTADARFMVSQAYDGLDDETPEDFGTYTLQGNVLTLLSSESSLYCPSAEASTYHVYRTVIDELAFVLEYDACDARRAPSTAPQVFASVDATGQPVRFPARTFVVGDYTQTFYPDGTYEFYVGDSLMVISTYEIRGDRLLWQSTGVCANSQIPVTEYTWAFDGTTLTLEPVEKDPCADRDTLMHLPYTRK